MEWIHVETKNGWEVTTGLEGRIYKICSARFYSKFTQGAENEEDRCFGKIGRTRKLSNSGHSQGLKSRPDLVRYFHEYVHKKIAETI
jgi:hypothetical protein